MDAAAIHDKYVKPYLMHPGIRVYTLKLLTMHQQDFVKNRFSTPKTKRTNVLITFAHLFSFKGSNINSKKEKKRACHIGHVT